MMMTKHIMMITKQMKMMKHLPSSVVVALGIVKKLSEQVHGILLRLWRRWGTLVHLETLASVLFATH